MDLQRTGDIMYLEIDFNSDKAFYVQLCDQIIVGIATSRLREGDALPSVRQLAEDVIRESGPMRVYGMRDSEGNRMLVVTHRI